MIHVEGSEGLFRRDESIKKENNPLFIRKRERDFSEQSYYNFKLKAYRKKMLFALKKHNLLGGFRWEIFLECQI